MSQQHEIETLLRDAVRYYDRGEPETAGRICQGVLELNPNDSAALHLSGLIANDAGDPQAAVCYLERAVRADGNDPDAWNDFGNALQRSGRIPDALAAFDEARRLAPEFASAHSNYGFMLYRQGAWEESLPHFQRAIDLDPDFILARNNLGSALLELRRNDEAVAVFQSALERNSQSADTAINLGNALRRCDQHTRAIDVLQNALPFAAQRAELWLNLGGCCKDIGQFAEAQSAYERAISVHPGYAEAHWNLALLLLAQGELGRGWEEFEWRRKVDKVASRIHPKNSVEWTGQLVADKSVLLVAEQGLGDTLQFIRYADTLQKSGSRVIAAVQPELLSILAGCRGVEQLVPLRPPFPPHDLYCLLMSVPRFLSPTVESIPNQIPYLRADESLVRKWRERLSALRGFKVGIQWQGNPNYMHDRYRSVPLHYFEPLAQVPGVQLISLQLGFGNEQLGPLRERMSVLDLGKELDRATGPFMDTAAVLQNLDLVISSDTALVHLAGALGVPVWVPTSYVADWRWLIDRTDSPWYPSMRLFRQHERLNWSGVFREISSALESRIATTRR